MSTLAMVEQIMRQTKIAKGNRSLWFRLMSYSAVWTLFALMFGGYLLSLTFKETIEDNARFFSSDEFQPHLSITMGIGTILAARKVVLLATGESKACAIQATVEGPLSAACPASALQMHAETTLIIDNAAASKLKDSQFYKHIERENQALLSRLGVC